MQTILGAGGQIADELARELHRTYTRDIRLVSRHPVSINPTDELVAADLMDPQATAEAVAGSEIVYLTVGLPMDSELWEQRFPTMMANTISACQQHGAKLVFFDNTYMYPGTAAPQTEDTPFSPAGRKGAVRAQLATMLREAMAAGSIEALICRAPEFYGPGRTQSLTNTTVFNRIAAGKRPIVPLTVHAKRSLIWTPDASRAMALIGNTADAYGQTWHLPVDPDRPTYAEIISTASEVVGTPIRPIVVPQWAFRLGGLASPALREVRELLPRYRQDNIFKCAQFAQRFPDFQITRYREGIAALLTQR